MGWDVVQLVERRIGTPLTQVRFPGAAKVFLPESTLSADSLTCVRTPPYAIACIVNIFSHVKDPVVHVSVRWIMETLKHPACTLGWVSRSRDSVAAGFPCGKQSEFPMGEIQTGQYSRLKKKTHQKLATFQSRVWRYTN